MIRLIALLLIIMNTAAYAQTAKQTPQPVEITAQKYLEWRRGDQTFVAEGQAKAVQGPTTIEAETLRAKYVEGENGKGMTVNELSADHGVVISSEQNSVYGDQAIYDVNKGYAVMTGKNLRMISPDQTITADERFEYWSNEGRVVAIGNAVVTRPKPQGGGVDTLKADKITAFLKDDMQGKRTVDRLEADGHVVITTPTETITGSHGVYQSATNKAEMTGGVKITRDQNILQGDRAEVDLNTNISKIFGGAFSRTPDGRVRAVFYPDSKKKEAP